MKISKLFQSGGWRRLRELIVNTLASSIPWPIGTISRRFLYGLILGDMGKSLVAETGIQFIHAHTVTFGNQVLIERNVRINNFSQNGQIILHDQVKIGRDVVIQLLKKPNGKIEIGRRTVLASHNWLSGHHIRIGEACLIASYVGIFANNHNYSDPAAFIQDQGHTFKGITIGNDCWIGSGVKILDGVTIGDGSVVGANAVVTRDIPAYSIAVGIPAKVIDQRGAHHSPPLELCLSNLNA